MKFTHTFVCSKYFWSTYQNEKPVVRSSAKTNHAYSLPVLLNRLFFDSASEFAC